MSEPTGNILPIYFVADESWSMSGDILELNNGLVSLLDTLQSETMAVAKVRFCIIGFSADANCYLEPTDLRELEDMPKLSARGSTSYGSAFRLLYERIPLDVLRLKEEGYLVNRPVVFFLTDGAPNENDDWEIRYGELVDPGFAQRPNILAFGIGDADANVIRKIASKKEYAFISASGVDTGSAIAEFMGTLTHSVVNSGQALASGSAELPVEKPKNFISLDVDIV